MDSWSVQELKTMRIGGNDSFNRYLETFGFSRNMSIYTKYNTLQCDYYRTLYK